MGVGVLKWVGDEGWYMGGIRGVWDAFGLVEVYGVLRDVRCASCISWLSLPVSVS